MLLLAGSALAGGAVAQAAEPAVPLLAPHPGIFTDAAAEAPALRLDIDSAASDPLLAPRLSDRSLDARSPRRAGVLGIEWQHTLNASQWLTVSARYGDYAWGEADTSAGTGTAAALGWSTLLGSETRMSGRVFLGDETIREPGPGLAPRRYYGLLLEGRYAFGREHAPFASLRWQRSDVEATDPLSAMHRESESRFAAGWSWQPRPDWDVRAEASYRFAEDLPDWIETDRARFGLSTRYGFR
jgi:hypothetical protein